MLFKDIVGHGNIKANLVQSAKAGRISHAQMFLGPEGSGNLALALAYAQFVSCLHPDQDDACGICTSCNKFNKLIHPDLHFVYPVASTKSVASPVSDDFIKEWRQAVLANPYMGLADWYAAIGLENKQGNIGKEESVAILRKLNLKTFEGNYKIMVIWMAEKMNDSCANKILKVLEEPPGNTIFLLVVESSDLILPTIVSRTQILKVPKPAQKDIAAQLAARPESAGHDLDRIAHLANGNFNKALQLLHENPTNQAFYESFVELMRLAYRKDVINIIQWTETMSSLGREGLKGFFEYALRMVRDNYMMNMQLDNIIYMDGQETDFSKKFHMFITDQNIQAIVDELSQAHVHIERNGYSKIVLLDMSLKLFGLINPRKST
jgi:DNA polymerase III subunit delta'